MVILKVMVVIPITNYCFLYLYISKDFRYNPSSYLGYHDIYWVKRIWYHI